MDSSENYKEKALDFLSNHSVAVLSTISAEGTPDAAVVYFYHDDQFNFFYITKSDTTKAKNAEQNHHAALTVVDQEKLVTIQAKGTIKNVELNENYPELFLKTAEVINKSGKLPPVAKLNDSGEYVLYVFNPTWLRFGDFSENVGADEKKSVFHQLIPENNQG